jgi:hypothetical protein
MGSWGGPRNDNASSQDPERDRGDSAAWPIAGAAASPRSHFVRSTKWAVGSSPRSRRKKISGSRGLKCARLPHVLKLRAVPSVCCLLRCVTPVQLPLRLPRMTQSFDIDYVLANISDQDKIALLSGLSFSLLGLTMSPGTDCS